MSNVVLPALPGITWELDRAPSFATKRQKSVAGIEITAAFQPYSLSTWGINYEVLRAQATFTELQTLLAFFIARQGAFDSFLYTAPDDNTIVSTSPQSLIPATGDGSNKNFQLTSLYGEPIYNPNGTVHVLDNGSSAGAHTVTNGLVSFTTAPTSGHTVTWYGAYYYRVRFSTDRMKAGGIVQGYWDCKGLALTQVLGS